MAVASDLRFIVSVLRILSEQRLRITKPDFVAAAEMFLGTPYLWGGKTSLEGLFRRGLEREGKALRELLEHPEAAWKDYVRHDALAPLLASPAADHPAELHTTAWLAVGFELWNGNRMSRLGTRHPPLVRAEGAG